MTTDSRSVKPLPGAVASGRPILRPWPAFPIGLLAVLLFSACQFECDWEVIAWDVSDGVIWIIFHDKSGNDIQVVTRKLDGRTPQEWYEELCPGQALPPQVGGGTGGGGSAVDAADALFADFNGDGLLDAVVADRATGAVLISLSLENGSFGDPVAYPTGPGPVRIRAGHFNGDPHLDLITGNEGESPSGEGSLSFLAGNGDGTFQAQVPQDAGGADMVTDVAVGDFDGDGDLDVAVGVFNGGFLSVLVRLGNGDGTFDAEVPLDALDAGQSVDVVNWNPDVDDHDDIVTDETVLLGNGDGTFQAPIDYAPGFSGTLARAGDLNDDGRPDIVAANLDNTLAVSYGNGDGSAQPPRMYAVGRFPTRIVFTDLNADGRTDLLMASAAGSDPASLLIRNGDGTLQAPAIFPTIPDLTRRLGADDAAVADFTGDGVPDIVVANGGALQGSLASPFLGGDPAVILIGLGNGNFGSAAAIPGQPGSQVVAGDWNGDDKQDLVFTGTGVQRDQLFIVPGNGDGTFETYAAIDLPGARREDHVLVAARLDTGETLDLLVANADSGDVSVFLGDGSGGFSAQPEMTVGTGANGIAAGDLNGDGRLDLAVTYRGDDFAGNGGVRTALGNGDGSFQPMQTLRSQVEPDSLAMADFNVDGNPDLAVSLQVAEFDWEVEIYLGLGDGTFLPPRAVGLAGTSVHSVSAADADLDGMPDLAVTEGGGSGRTFGLRGRGDGTFRFGGSGSLGGGFARAADLDLDGRPDLICPTRDGFITVLTNTLPPVLRISRGSDTGLHLRWADAFPDHRLMESANPARPLLWQSSTAPVTQDDQGFNVHFLVEEQNRVFRLEAEAPEETDNGTP